MLLYRREAEQGEDEDDGVLTRRVFPVDDGSDSSDDETAAAVPPADGLEYLRRVRKEARRLPNVVRAHLDDPLERSGSEAESAGSSSLPLPPPALRPDQRWEGELLCEFDSLRRQLAAAAISPRRAQPPPLPNVADVSAWETFCFGRQHGDGGHPPAMRVVLALDQRAALRLLQMMHMRLERERTLSDPLARWIFALLSRPERALPAEHAATLRALLCTCVRQRAALGEGQPTEGGDGARGGGGGRGGGGQEWLRQAAALNTLIAILGCYFGQASAEERGSALQGWNPS